MKPGASILLALLAASCGGRAGNDGPAGGSGGSLAGAAGAAGSAAGSGGGSGGLPPAGQSILFEVSHENYAWGATLKGMFITADGAVHSYDYFASGAGAPGFAAIFPATEQELRAHYGSAITQTGSVPIAELMAKFALVETAASGVLLQEYACDDAGSTSYLGYLYDPATARYSRVILGVDGDLAAHNNAPVASELLSWLKPLGGQPSTCEFKGVQCTGALCNTPAPACPSGQVASVEDDCWGPCVPVTRCLAVSECSACQVGATACATSTTGSHHCLPMYCASTDVCACPFVPPCAGGADYCTTSGSLQVTCGP